ncbi:NAD(P)/FAD-dependent oxidoreductase [Pyxidicoccus fallax]|uniref:NAD(P)/FAD-dependent oxidoreductase n=1 Tax=Pyxidicoccus fallax TaxID=394095 RepID=A0A848LM13_9BACT|nr:NAD(P)/FAD-dependent oxidoreductase [Pyxidicoccus fallax]NMO18683.1 NAD(P)/FAD-dependent oxidoreductase [Pyxidicoccus fallax]NPC79134.1 NAD(P)/FAD-dependent oxidoreductase [Pyxidicoccus fallax]
MDATRKAVVIGTGAGGLAAAAFLARMGFEVTAVEQGAHLGGSLAPFEREGFTFDVGINYVGGCRPGQLMYEQLAALGLDASALFSELEPDGFDIYRFPDFEVRNCAGLERFRDRLRALFPDEDAGLREVFRLLARVRELMHLGARLPRGGLHAADLRSLEGLPLLWRLSRRTWGELLQHHLGDERARAALSAMSGDWGLPPGRVAAITALAVIADYADGAFFPRGGGGALLEALVDSARTCGAVLRTESPARRIHISRGCVTGVELEEGEVLEADVIVSDVDPTVTLKQLVGPEHLSARVQARVGRTDPSLGMAIVYLGLRRDLRQHGMSAANLWSYPSTDLDGLYAPLGRGALPPELPLLLSSNSLKDTSGRLAPPGCSTLSVATFVPEALFERWASVPPAARGEGYFLLKEHLADRMLREVESRFPGLIGDIAVREVATPLNWIDSLRAPHGAPYGPAMTPGQAGRFRFRTRTPVQGLFLAGQGVLSMGISPVLLSGRLAAHAAEHYVERRGRLRHHLGWGRAWNAESDAPPL